MHILPSIAREASVLIMPYADLPVTRAMQPLKLKEYMATGRPVVVNHLPSTATWSDCLEVAHSPEQFSQLVRTAISRGTGASQRAARQRLQHESWSARAELLLQVIQNGTRTPQTERNTQ
jgi:glycosyltransferase involved in cell wall biosynthesis